MEKGRTGIDYLSLSSAEQQDYGAWSCVWGLPNGIAAFASPHLELRDGAGEMLGVCLPLSEPLVSPRFRIAVGWDSCMRPLRLLLLPSVRTRACLCCLVRTMPSRGAGSQSRAGKVAVSKTPDWTFRGQLTGRASRPKPLLDVVKAQEASARATFPPPFPGTPCPSCFFIRDADRFTPQNG
ncbi:hypothetical protein J3F83DRAFT_58315 [Trichoderma novae-zelandiae]